MKPCLEDSSTLKNVNSKYSICWAKLGNIVIGHLINVSRLVPECVLVSAAFHTTILADIFAQNVPIVLSDNSIAPQF